MAIIVKAKKVVPGTGEESWTVLELTALETDGLPSLYKKSEPSFRKNGSTFDCWSGKFSNDYLLRVGETYSKEDFVERLDYCRKAGQRLSEINKLLAWTGEETFVI